MPRSLTKSLLILVALLFAACSQDQQAQVMQLPTLAVLPSATPTDTATPIPTFTETPTPRPTDTGTPNMLATQVAQGDLTNQALQTTLAALQTQMVASPTTTPTPSTTFTPSQTITDTLTPTQTGEPIQAIDLKVLFVRATANLRACARRSCAQVAQVREGDTVMATGTTQGEIVTGGNALWYRVDLQGQQVFIYSDLVADAPPTFTPTPLPLPLVVTLAPAQPSYDSYGSTGGSIRCNDGSYSSATNSQGACSGHGGIYSPPTAAPSGGGIPCRDGTTSYAAHRQGACSHHGGIAD